MKRLISTFCATFLLLSLSIPLAGVAGDENGGWDVAFVLNSDNGGETVLNPSSLFIDELSEKYYVVDSGNNRLVSFDIKGGALHSFSAGGKLIKPVSMTKTEEGILLVVEKGKGGITKIDLINKAVTTDELTDKGRKLYPQKIRISNNAVYVLEKSRGSIFAISNDSTIIQQYTCDSCLMGFTDFHLINNDIWALSQQEGEIVSFSQDGQVNKSIHLQPKPEFPVSFAISRDGDFFVVERHQGRISVYDSEGSFRYAIFAKGEKEGNLYYPIEVQFDPWGRLCVVEEGNGRVSVFKQ